MVVNFEIISSRLKSVISLNKRCISLKLYSPKMFAIYKNSYTHIFHSLSEIYACEALATSKSKCTNTRNCIRNLDFMNHTAVKSISPNFKKRFR